MVQIIERIGGGGEPRTDIDQKIKEKKKKEREKAKGT